MQSLTGPGIVLRRAREFDTDIRLTLFLRDHGKLYAVSKGGLKMSAKLKAVQEPFTEADFHVMVPEHGHTGRLVTGKLLSSHHGIGSSLLGFEIAARCCESIEAMFPFRAPSADVFDILRQTLHSLETTQSPNVEWILFVIGLLKSLGHGDVSEKASQLLEKSIDQCLLYVDAEMERVLPRPLKSQGISK